MTTKTKSEENTSLLRVPKAKNKFGLKIPKIAMPHDDLIVAEKPKLEIVPTPNQSTSMTTHTSLTSQTSVSSHTSQSKKSGDEIAPTKNYQKVANSITKQAIPDGFFKGKDKHLYDVLYSLTRGAIEPKRSVRVSKTKLMKLSSIGSRITFDACIERLEAIGLLNLKIHAGEHEGNSFEILLPEEIETLTSQTSQTSLTSPAQKLDRLVRLETSQTSQSLNSMNATTSTVPKTSFKDNIKTDDEGAAALFSDFIEKFQTAATKLTGAKLLKYEREKWGRLADLLILELETASRHASNPVSSVPAFLTKVLSSKLLNQKPAERISKSKSGTKPDTVGKYYPEPDGSDDQVRSLNDESKEAAVDFLREFKDDAEFMEGYKKWYTEEDWNWIIQELEIKN